MNRPLESHEYPPLERLGVPTVAQMRASHDHVACAAGRTEVKAEFGFDFACQFCIDHAAAKAAYLADVAAGAEPF